MLDIMNWNKPLRVNGVVYENSQKAHEALKDSKESIKIELNFSGSTEQHKPKQEEPKDDAVYRIHVKNYMTEKSVPAFDFMKKWNNDIPMPFVVMYGTIIEETKGMYKMKLHARMESNSTNCMHCGRKLTNVVSRNYGIGPICGKHYNIASQETIEDFKKNEEAIRKAIESVQWSGWIIKSAIKEKRNVTNSKKGETA